MGWLQDLLKEVPLSSVLKERVELAEAKYEGALKESAGYKQRIVDLQRENEELRAQIPSKPSSLGKDTESVLVHLFKTASRQDRDVGIMAGELGMERSVMQYHLDRLKDASFAKVTSGNYIDDHTYWGLTPEGRQHAVESKLI